MAPKRTRASASFEIFVEAIRVGDLERVRAQLLRAAPGIDVNRADEDGKTPLYVGDTFEIRLRILCAGGTGGRFCWCICF